MNMKALYKTIGVFVAFAAVLTIVALAPLKLSFALILLIMSGFMGNMIYTEFDKAEKRKQR